MFELKFERKDLPIEQLENNRGQLYGLPANPRYIKDERFAKLKKSITDDPEYMEIRELVVYPLGNGNYVVLGGNMRLNACRDLKWHAMPCKILPLETPVAKLRAYVIKDNESFGNTDWDLLANEWDVEELKGFGMELDFITPDSTDIDDFFEEADQELNDTKEKDVVISVTIPFAEADTEDAIRELLANALTEYPNISIK